MASALIKVLLFCASALLHMPTVAGLLRIVDKFDKQAERLTASGRKVGDGPGRPLYSLHTIELGNTTGKHCISLSVDKAQNALVVEPKPQDVNSVAWGCYHDQISSTGWSDLQVSTTTDVGVPLAVKAYGAGLVEGLLTADRMRQFHSNVVALHAKDTTKAGSAAAVDHVVRMSLIAWETYSGGDASVTPQDDLTKQAWAALIQMRGIRDGHNNRAAKFGWNALSIYQMMLMNMHAELPAVTELYADSAQASNFAATGASLLQTGMHRSEQSVFRRAMQIAEHGTWQRWSAHEARGSALVRRIGPLGNPEDLLSGHVTIAEYGEMTRIMKNYAFDFDSQIKGISMSSYPGCISSTDDYIITDKGFVAMSASLGTPTSGEHSKVPKTNDGLPSFLRAAIASRLATQPRTWARVYGFIKGIAGAKQWLLADYSKIKDHQPIANDTVWLVESLSSTQEASDVSENLRTHGFFEVHGIPIFARTREAFGLSKSAEDASQASSSSALAEKATAITDLPSARSVLTEMSPTRVGQKAVSPRMDLHATDPIPAGGIDAKVTSKCLVEQLAMQARSGPPPTPNGGAFTWGTNGTEAFPGWPHDGMPESWNFAWVDSFPGDLTSPLTPTKAMCTAAPVA
eukprot:gnl/TRDRNA2_/TRDRNA2_37265_c0_seq1.p1 gnl/TRDRNA2_/TRDRNA2_37265_c0~~gnl/TRDRNA2_/TRDRNA2_37265_c0_seq1.p1  ORF type:complete len:630 (-),score=117.72 gnl/TRDRNA2_/TRDRNA2_37265_c0_seq1:29-1918(-)